MADTLRAETVDYCLIGGNTAASPSPRMMNAAFAATSMEYSYRALSVRKEDLASTFEALKKKGLRGMSVTIPFKVVIIPILDGLDAVSGRIGAVNVVNRARGGEYRGYNTDVRGIVEPLRERRREVRHALLIGSGGAARAFVEAMHELKECTRISVLVRDPARARDFSREMKQAYPEIQIDIFSFDNPVGLQHPDAYDILFNATPMGSQGVPLEDTIARLVVVRSGRGMVVFDAVYTPKDTELLKLAKKSNKEIVYGYEMLLHQGVAAFELWTGKRAPHQVMERELLSFLAGGGQGS